MTADKASHFDMQPPPGCISLEKDEEICGGVASLCERQLRVYFGQRICEFAQIKAAIVVSVRQREQLFQSALHIKGVLAIAFNRSICLQVQFGQLELQAVVEISQRAQLG